jgi:CDP-6-deoxy-D-xylo-4-hexulose-3-dehydrase
MSTGEGGMVCCDDKSLMKIMRSLAYWGRDCNCYGANNMLKDGTCGKRFDKWLETYDGVVDHKYVFSNMGYNLKPLDLQGAIGLAQLLKFPLIEVYRNLTKIIIEKTVLENVKGVRGVKHFPEATPCWFGVPFICEEQGLKHKLVAHLESHKIQTRNYFAGNILQHPGYSFLGDYKDFPEASNVLETVFFLGCPPFYTDSMLNYIEKVVKEFRI